MTISLVQSNKVNSTTTVTSQAITLSTGVTLGNLLVAAVGMGNLVDNATGPTGWTQAVINTETDINDQMQTSLWYLVVGAGQAGQTSWTWTFDQSHSVYMSIEEWHSTNGWPASPVDQTANAPTANPTVQFNNLTTGTTATTTQASELWVAQIAYVSAPQTETSITSGWTKDVESTSSSRAATMLYKVATATGAASCGYTIGTMAYYSACIATFKDNVSSTHTLGTLTRSTFTTRMALKTNTRATFKTAAVLKSLTRATFKTAMALKTPTRARFVTRMALKSLTRATFITRMALTSPVRARFLTAMALKTPARATFQTRLAALSTRARATFKTRISALSTHTRASFKTRIAALTSHARAMFVTRMALISPTRATFKVASALKALGTVARVTFQTRISALSTPTRATFKTRISALTTAARSTFQTRIATLTTAARSTFKINAITQIVLGAVNALLTARSGALNALTRSKAFTALTRRGARDASTRSGKQRAVARDGHDDATLR